jgi:hypothetical protein
VPIRAGAELDQRIARGIELVEPDARSSEVRVVGLSFADSVFDEGKKRFTTVVFRRPDIGASDERVDEMRLANEAMAEGEPEGIGGAHGGARSAGPQPDSCGV